MPAQTENNLEKDCQAISLRAQLINWKVSSWCCRKVSLSKCVLVMDGSIKLLGWEEGINIYGVKLGCRLSGNNKIGEGEGTGLELRTYNRKRKSTSIKGYNIRCATSSTEGKTIEC